MKLTVTKTIIALAVFAAAGCATNPSAGWGFRYEDRDKIAEAATKIEGVAASLQELALRPESYLANKSMNMAATYDTNAADTVRFFATEAGRFLRAVRAWQPDGNIGLDYSSLIRQWNAMKNASGRLLSSEKMRVKMETLNAMMIDLGRLTGPAGGGDAKIGAQPSKPAGR
ncbi:MAG: hypothetical protein NT105_21930 [Verrucomicrobia bacterium]|nr:hypothetical protein [Verrucomicrobiota bacterium]